MSTGYTSEIANNISFKDFVLQCARAFGALTTMRDDPMDKPIPNEFKPSDYHSKRIAEIMKDAKRIESLTEDETQAEADKERKNKMDTDQKCLDETRDLRAKYEKMLVKVKQWTPPSTEHEGLKTFMIKQITDSIDFDCKTHYYTKKKYPVKSGKQWREDELKELRESLDYHTTQDNEERERVAGRNLWVKQLRESLD